MKPFSLEKVLLFVLGVSCFIGIWHAFPMLNVSGDEMYFVGSVLRAMEHHTVLPSAFEVPYGTLTYFLNYLLIALAVVLALPFFRFDLGALKTFLIQSPELAYLIPRLLSACIAVLILVGLWQFFKRIVPDRRVALYLLVLTFTNMILTVILHTGKAWVLAMALLLASVMLTSDAVAHADNQTRARRGIFLSVFLAFLGIANFPFNLYSLVCIPILAFVFRHNRPALWLLVKSVIAGGVILALVTLLNWQAIQLQVTGAAADLNTIGVSTAFRFSDLFASFWIYTLKTLYLFPLTLLALAFAATNRIRDKKLFTIALIYFVVYFLTVTLAANGPHLPFTEKFRYVLPLGFFLSFLIASLLHTFRKYMVVIGGVALAYFAFTIYLLAAPTTYNEVNDWAKATYGHRSDVVIVNKTISPILQFPMNKASFLAMDERYCATRCQNTVRDDLDIGFAPLVLDEKSVPEYTVEGLAKTHEVLIVLPSTTSTPGLELVRSFTNPIPDAAYHTIDYNWGNYLDLTYLKTTRTGHNIYVYRYAP